MKKAFNYAFMAVVGLMTTMCTSTPAQTGDQEEEMADKLYEFKSAIIEETFTRADSTEAEMSSIVYIDNYGATEYEITTVTSSGKLAGTTFQTPDSLYIVIQEDTIGSKMANKPTNWLNMTDEVMQSKNIKHIGQEEVDGKMCEVYTRNSSFTFAGNTSISDETFYIWKGYPIKVVNQSSKGTSVTKVTSFKENVEIPADKTTFMKNVAYELYIPEEQADSTKVAE